MPYLSALEVCARQGAIPIHVYLNLPSKLLQIIGQICVFDRGYLYFTLVRCEPPKLKTTIFGLEKLETLLYFDTSESVYAWLTSVTYGRTDRQNRTVNEGMKVQ